MKNRFFKLFANCIVVKGPTKSIICDLFKERYRDIPNELYPLFENSGLVDLEKINETYPSAEDQEGIHLFLSYFVDNDWAFYTNTPEYFPELNLNWDSASKITNAILDIDENSTYDLEQCILAIKELGCIGIQFRFYSPTNPDLLDVIAKSTADSEFEYIEIITSHNKTLTADYYHDYVKDNRRISKIMITNSSVFEEANNNKVVFLKEKIDYANACGIINPKYFTTNIEHFTETTQFNSCLNRKLGIDVDGNIKNCPSMKNDFGKCGEQSLQKIVENLKFQEYWSINKDNIEVCKDCEYRLICSDCRAFTVDNKKHGKPSKCNYDPYTGIWDEKK